MYSEIVIDGNMFCNLEEFYCEIDRLLTKNLSWKTGHSLDAFNDLLCGGFGVHEYGEALSIKWINAQKSREDFGYDATASYFQHMLKICHPTNIEHIQKRLLDAENNQGRTLMDIISDIILNTDNSGHSCSLELVE